MRGNVRMVGKYLLDASAIYPLILKLREGFLSYANMFTVLDLTIYEVGNVIWKEFKKGKIKDVTAVAKLFDEVFNYVNIL